MIQLYWTRQGIVFFCHDFYKRGPFGLAKSRTSHESPGNNWLTNQMHDHFMYCTDIACGCFLGWHFCNHVVSLKNRVGNHQKA
jgi:hypothetical protein